MKHQIKLKYNISPVGFTNDMFTQLYRKPQEDNYLNKNTISI